MAKRIISLILLSLWPVQLLSVICFLKLFSDALSTAAEYFVFFPLCKKWWRWVLRLEYIYLQNASFAICILNLTSCLFIAATNNASHTTMHGYRLLYFKLLNIHRIEKCFTSKFVNLYGYSFLEKIVMFYLNWTDYHIKLSMKNLWYSHHY
jgi:hypothetical protein